MRIKALCLAALVSLSLGACSNDSDGKLSTRAWASHTLDHGRTGSYGQRVGFEMVPNQSWVRYAGEAYEDVFVNDYLCDANPILPTADGGLLVLTVAAQVDGVNRVFVLKYDAAGIAQWDRAFEESGCAGRALTIDFDTQGDVRVATLVDGAVCLGRLTADGDLLDALAPQWSDTQVARSQTPRVRFDPQGPGAYFVYQSIIKLDGQGGSDWTRTVQEVFATRSAGAFSEIGVGDNGELVAAGQLTGPEYPWAEAGSGQIAVAKLDSAGATQWTFLRPGYPFADDPALVESVGIAADGSVFLLGLEGTKIDEGADSFYLGLDAQGAPTFERHVPAAWNSWAEVELHQPASARQRPNGDWLLGSARRHGNSQAELRLATSQGASVSNLLVGRNWNGGSYSGGDDKLEDARVAPDGSVYVTGCAGTGESIACIGTSFGSRGRFIAKYEAP